MTAGSKTLLAIPLKLATLEKSRIQTQVIKCDGNTQYKSLGGRKYSALVKYSLDDGSDLKLTRSIYDDAPFQEMQSDDEEEDSDSETGSTAGCLLKAAFRHHHLTTVMSIGLRSCSVGTARF